MWTYAVAQCNDLIVCRHPFYTGHDFYHHIIIIMDIEDDMMDAIPNNQPYFRRPWSTSVRLVGEVAGFNGCA
jgi:hypothetical protein